jgi:hypothetical protein
MKNYNLFVIIIMSEFEMQATVEIVAAMVLMFAAGYFINGASEYGYWKFIEWKNKKKK